MNKLQNSNALFSTFLSVLFATLSFYIINPANSGTDENWSAKAAWYLSENPTKVFSKSGIIDYPFPAELALDEQSHGKLLNTPCWWASIEIPRNCQNLNSIDGFKVQKFDRVFRSVPYLYMTGATMHIFNKYNVYEVARLFNFVLIMFLTFLTLVNINKSKYGSNLPTVLIAFTPSFYYTASGVGPAGFEISMALLFASLLLRLDGEKPNLKMLSYVFATLLLFGFARPLAPVWACLILLLFVQLYGKILFLKFCIALIFVTMLVQTQIDNSSWRFGTGTVYEVDKNTEFYLEETIRTLLNMGKWFYQILGVYQIGSSVELPLIFLLFYFVALSQFFHNTLDSMQDSKKLYSILFVGIFLTPIAISVIFSGNWPGWWSGRYGMPFFCTAVLLLVCKTSKVNRRGLFLFTALLVVLSSVLNFFRWNFGLFPTYTPIISNGWSINLGISLIYFFALFFYSCSIFYLSKKLNKSTDQSR